MGKLNYYVEVEDSAGIYSVASKIASIPVAIRCIVYYERELAGDVGTAGFARMADDDYCCWCARGHRSRKPSNG